MYKSKIKENMYDFVIKLQKIANNFYHNIYFF